MQHIPLKHDIKINNPVINHVSKIIIKNTNIYDDNLRIMINGRVVLF